MLKYRNFSTGIIFIGACTLYVQLVVSVNNEMYFNAVNVGSLLPEIVVIHGRHLGGLLTKDCKMIFCTNAL